LALRTVTFQCLLNGVEQVLVAERLGEKLDCPSCNCSTPLMKSLDPFTVRT
jgi:hypothetical protein